MTQTIIGLILGAILFALFKRKRLRRLRDRYVEMRRRAVRAKAGRNLAAALGAAGFFNGLPADAERRIKTEIETYGYGGVFSHPWRAVSADDEELAEGQVGVFLQELAPSLIRLGVEPLVGKSRFMDGGAHMLDLPGETVTLVSADEAREDDRNGGKRFGFSWGAVGARVLERLNRQIAAAGREDRFHSVYGGNDAQALLLNPPMLAAIMASPGIRPDELPYIRTIEWPLFGAPEMPKMARP
jgi:hypothetical protein